MRPRLRRAARPVLGGARLTLRRLAVTLLAAVLTAALAATGLTLAWALVDPGRALTDAPYAWLGLFAVTLAFGSVAAALFGLAVPPVAALLGRRHAGWRWLTCALGGGALVLLTTDLRFAALGVLGGLLYAGLEARFMRPREP